MDCVSIAIAALPIATRLIDCIKKKIEGGNSDAVNQCKAELPKKDRAIFEANAICSQSSVNANNNNTGGVFRYELDNNGYIQPSTSTVNTQR